MTPVANTATVASETDDPDETNNTSTATFDVRSASLTVTKVTAGGEAGEFEVTITDSTGATVASDLLANGDTLPLTDVVPGTYTVTETLPGGLFRVAGIACSNEQTTTSNTLPVTLIAGDDVTCTITNETFDLSVEKTASPAVITAGAPADVVTWTITVTNEGSGDAFADATVTDVLPDELAWDEASLVPPAGVTCDFAGQTLTCTIPAAQLTAGASVVITAEASAPADTAPDTYYNAVVVSSPDDPDCPDGVCEPPPCPVPTNGEVVAAAVVLSNNQACEPVQVDAEADMQVVITAAPGPYTPGETVSFEVDVVNAGPSDAVNAEVVITLPPEFVPGSITNVTVTSPDGVAYVCVPDLTAGTITCTVPLHQVGDEATITFDATLVPSGLDNGQTIVIPAEVSADTPDPVLPNNSSTDLVVIQLGGLSIVKELRTNADFPSGTFRFIVERLDEEGAPTAVVFDGDVSASLTNPGTQVVAGLSAGRYRVTEVLANPLVPFRFVSAECQLGEEETIISDTPSIEAYVGAGDSVACIFTNESFNLKMGKTDGGVTVTAGTNFAYTLTVTKQGFGAATSSATVTDTLPGAFTWIGTPTGAGATCSVSADAKSLTCTVTADQLNTGSAVITGQVRAPASMASGTYTNTAVVDSPEDPAAGFQPPAGQAGAVDPYAADNTATDTTPVVRQAAVDIVKVDDLIPDGFTVPGGTFRYTMTVTNPTGPSTATGVTIADTLPAGLTLVSAVGTNWSCTAGTVNCTYTVPIEVGATSAPLVVTVTVSTGITADTTLVNTATATCVETALAPCTDSSTEQTPVKVPVLPPTGADPYRSVTIGVSLFAGGWLLVLLARWRRRQSALL
jgi:large repetitive protein